MNHINSEVLEYLKEIERTTGMHLNVADDVSKADVEAALNAILQRYSDDK